MEFINKSMDFLWGSEITSINFNILEHSINIRVKIFKDGEEDIEDISFQEVTAFYWNNDYISQEDKRRMIEDWNYIDLNSIIYNPLKATINVKLLSEVGGHIKNCAYPNIVVEMWDSILLIEAGKIMIDNREYKLNHKND